MNRCIKCGREVRYFDHDSRAIPRKIGCDHCHLEWTLADHKDDGDWAVRHIRLLESKTQALEDQIVGLMQQNVDLATKVEILISNLEKALNVDVNGDGTIQQ